MTKPFKDASTELKMLLEPLSLFTVEQPPKALPKELPKPKVVENHKKTVDSSCDYVHCLVECVEKQLKLKQDSYPLSPEEQQELITVLLQEVNHIQPHIKDQISNPSLSEIQQKKLSSSLHQSVVQACEKLFLYYCDKAQVLNERGIFSGTANICRLRTQLTLHAEKILSLLRVRHVFVSMKDPMLDNSLERPENVLQRRSDSSASGDISEIIKQMPSINSDGLLPASLYHLSQIKKQSRSPNIATSADQIVTADFKERCESIYSESPVFIKRCYSHPQLFYESLWTEIGRETPQLRRCQSLENQHFSEFLTAFDWEEQNHLDKNGLQQQEWFATTKINQDLQTLLKNRKDDQDLESLLLDDMPPLIKAVPEDQKRKKAREKLDKQIQELCEKEEILQQKESLENLEPAFEQPTILTTQLSTQTVARTTDVRISKRIKSVDHHLISKYPQYNDLLGEIDSDSMKNLDKTLFEEKNLTDVFKKFLDSMTHGDTFFDNETTFIDVPSNLELSATLENREKEVLNEELCQFNKPPWFKSNYNQWQLQPAHVIMFNNKEIYPRIPDMNEPIRKERRDLKYWRSWWKSIVCSDDYIKFLSLQETDYLAVIFHLFGNEEEEEEKEKEGRGRNILITEPAIRSPQIKDLAQEEVKKRLPEKLDSPTSEEIKVLNMPQLQGRLDKMWNALQMPEDLKIEMAMKYAKKEKSQQLESSLSDWEQAAQFIIERESIMASLLVFESEASDPNRFFVRGPGNANLRLQEAKTRSMFYQRIEQLDKKLSKLINIIHKKYGEVVTFQDRPYLEKMRWDRVEMLYWLQEVRKLNALHYESRRLRIPLPEMSFKELLLSGSFFTQ